MRVVAGHGTAAAGHGTAAAGRGAAHAGKRTCMNAIATTNNIFSFILVNHLLDINLLHPSTLKECVCLFTVS